MKKQQDLHEILTRDLFGAVKVAVLGIGSDLRADDVAGMLIAQQLGSKIKRSAKLKKHVKIFLGNTAPENLTGDIKSYKPSHLVLIDSCDMNKKAGGIGIIRPEDIGGITFSTHQLPLKIIVDYMQRSINCEIIILGIQPKVLKFGLKPSKEVLKTAKELSNALFNAIKSAIK